MTVRSIRNSVALVLGLWLLTPAGVSAHEATKGPNGGALVDVQGHHVEFVPSAGEVTFYLSGEQDAPIVSTGAKVKVIIQDGANTTQIDLVVAEPNRLVAKLSAPLTSGSKVVFTGALADGHALQAKFVTP